MLKAILMKRPHLGLRSRMHRFALSVQVWRQQRKFDATKYWHERHRIPGHGIRAVGLDGYTIEENEKLYAEKGLQMAGYLAADFADLTRIKMLDLGCGQGHYAKVARNLSIGTYTGVDFGSTVLGELANRYPGFNFITGDITTDSPIFDEKYDAILLIDVIYHIVDDTKFKKLLANIQRSAKAGSVIYVTLTDKNSAPHAHMKYRSMRALSLLTKLGEVKGPDRWMSNSSIIRINVKRETV